MEVIELNLTHPQHLKLAKGHPFQLSPEDLIGKQTYLRPHRVRFHIHKKGHTRLIRNMRAGKGHRFQPEEIEFLEGDGILSSLKKGVRKAADFVKKHVPQRLVEKYVDRGIDELAVMSGHPELATFGKSMSNKIINSAYGASNSKQFKEDAQKILFNDAKDYSLAHLNNYIEPKTALEGGRLRKKSKAGTKEMAEKMERVRAMRGKGILKDLKNFGRKVKKAIPFRDIIKTTAGMAVAGLTENPLLAGIAQPMVNKGIDTGLNKANIGIGFRKSKIPRRKLKGGSFLPAGY